MKNSEVFMEENEAPSLMRRMEAFWDDENKEIDKAIGRDIGFDFARVGLKLPDDCKNSVLEGYAEGIYSYGKNPEESGRYERKLIRLRLSAYKRNRVVDPMLTPAFLSVIDVNYCPITRMKLTSGTGTETDATVDRVFNGGGYAIGNIAVMSQKANKEKGSLMPDQILAKANSEIEHGKLSKIEWMRLACLTALAAPPAYPQAHLPLFVYPPNGILLSNGYTLIQQCCSAICAGYLQQRWEFELRQVLQGKSSKKKFDSFMESLIGQISHRFRGVSDTENQWFCICDSWEIELVYKRYIKLIESLNKNEIVSLINVSIRAQQSLKKLSSKDMESWSLETRGYTK